MNTFTTILFFLQAIPILWAVHFTENWRKWLLICHLFTAPYITLWAFAFMDNPVKEACLLGFSAFSVYRLLSKAFGMGYRYF